MTSISISLNKVMGTLFEVVALSGLVLAAYASITKPLTPDLIGSAQSYSPP